MTRARLLHLIGAAIVLVYFFRFTGGGLRAGFAGDDPMNIYYYWIRGPDQLLRNLVLFFTTYGRPMGGVYYSLLYYFFGLNPFPYHVATTCLLLVNTLLAYRFVLLLTGSELTAGFCSFLVAYHSELAQLVYMPSFIYDVLCFTFYFGAWNYYLSIRRQGFRMRRRQVAAFLLLYIGALDSKEMAVTLPGMVLLYEAMWHAPTRWSARSAAAWARTEAFPALAAGLVTLVFVLGKTFGAESLVRTEAYRPVFTWDRYLESTARFLNTLFYQPLDQGFFGSGKVLLAAALLLGIAWRTRQKLLFFLWCFIFLTPLPIAFVPGRGGGSLYIPLVGWAVLLGSQLVSATAAVAKFPGLRRVPPAWTRGALVLCAVALQWAVSSHQTVELVKWMKDEGKLTRSVLEQIRSLQPTVPPGARIYVLNDVFDGFDTKYLLELTYHDRTVQVWLERHGKPTPAEMEQMDYIFTFENGTLKRLKGT